MKIGSEKETAMTSGTIETIFSEKESGECCAVVPRD